MAEYELLQHAFPEGVALLILRFLSHPVADTMRGMMEQWKYYRELSEGQQLDFAQYWQNARTLPEVRSQYLCNLTRTTTRWKDHMHDFDEGMPLFMEHMTFIPGLYEVVADDEVESVRTEDIEEVGDE